MSCCTPDGTCATNAGASTTATIVADTVSATYRVSGMTCGHCTTAITTSVASLDDVVAVDVDLDGGLVTVPSVVDLGVGCEFADLAARVTALYEGAVVGGSCRGHGSGLGG